MLKTIKTNSNSQIINNENELKSSNNDNVDEESFQTKTLKLPLTSNECLSFYMPDFTAATTQLNENNHDETSNAMSFTNEKLCNNNNEKEHERCTLLHNIEKANVLKEILSSEKKYLNDLSEIVEVNNRIFSIMGSSTITHPSGHFDVRGKLTLHSPTLSNLFIY
jgi:hypothetical protein